MLCLGRKEGERILVGEDIVIVVRSIRGRCVRLAIEAPGKRILREDAKRKEAA